MVLTMDDLHFPKDFLDFPVQTNTVTTTFTQIRGWFIPCACGVTLLSTSANIPLALVVAVTDCNLHWWCHYKETVVIIIMTVRLQNVCIPGERQYSF